MFADFVGVAASLAVIATFYSVIARRARVLAIGSNLLFIGYAALVGLWPVLLLHGILLPLNALRLWQLERHVSVPSQELSGAATLATRRRAGMGDLFAVHSHSHPCRA
ncbi:MAG: hypothetical protein AAF618_15205 [Pseudomonadota bacterium]